ncbi:hypothetical protein CDD81_7215 [Ophiocordyceps australis]|uniref:Tethering factor for nuclear proteasome STS1 n=1 Tax=Ophiocordyceps australis TaxID=1399860 RepID=A0A2C5Y3X6_9HYPO|nr:hypothetical protein CDD81_7215 [Ophiocordyceps australis]
MNVCLMSPQPPAFHRQQDNHRRSPQRSVSPISSMTSRKRKADDDGDETMSPMSSPAVSARALVRPAKKIRPCDVYGRQFTLPRLLETLDVDQLRTVLERICQRHPEVGQEVVAQAPRPSVASVLEVLHGYQNKLKAAIPYGETSPEYTYCRVKESLIALIDALFDFVAQFLPPNEILPSKSFQFLDGATKLIHELPDWEPLAYRHHKDHAYEEISKAWALAINEAGKRGGGINLHTCGWDETISRHNQQSGGRQPATSADQQNSVINQLISGTYGSPVRVGPW